MNKTVLIFVTLLVVATGALTYHFLVARVPEAPAPVAVKIQPPPSLLGKGKNKPTAPATHEHRTADRLPDRPAGTNFKEPPGMQEMRKKMAEATNRMTPEMRKMIVDAAMRMREPRYRELFDAWNLDPAAAEDTLRILRDRETSHSDLRTKYWGDASSDLSEFSDATKAESTAAESRLLSVLGQHRLMELVQEEEKMKAEASARARETIERYKH